MIRQICGIPQDASWKGFMERFPILFRDRNKSCKETCMCWGIECPIGWYSILEQLCTILEYNNIQFVKNHGIAIVADQVKEKYGTLRFYYTVKYTATSVAPSGDPIITEGGVPNNEDPKMKIVVDYLQMIADKYIDEAEALTEKTCADCGGHDDIIVTKGWIAYICKKCNAKREKEYEKQLEEIRKTDAKSAARTAKV